MVASGLTTISVMCHSALYASAGCSACHGKTGRSSMLKLGPSFEGLKEHWTKDTLLEYIADPAAFAAKDARLGKRQMTAISTGVPPAAREKLVEYVLTLMN